MHLIYTLLSSVIFIASFPFNLSGYLAFISLVPWFVSLSQISEIKKTAASGALFGIIISLYFSLPLYQSISISSPDNIIRPVLLLLFTAIAPNLIMYCLFSILMRWIYDKPQHFHIFLPASLWILLDYLKELSTVMIPWGFAGYTQVFSPFIQFAEITGIHGISFLIIMINSIIAEIIMIILNEFHYGNKTEKIESSYVLTNKLTFILSNKSFFIYLFLFCVVFTTFLLYGNVRKKFITDSLKNSAQIKYLIVQGNSESLERWNESTSSLRYQTYIQLTNKKINETDFTVWPETVLNSSDKINFEIMSGISTKLRDSGFFITGGIRRDNNGNNYNSIFIMSKNNLEYIYDKKILFPYSERPFFGSTAGSFLNSPEKFTEGKSRDIFKTGDILTGYSICFESIYPSVIRKQARSGSSLLINVANDSWFGDSSVPHLQQYAIIARAIENRISIIRSANSGISFAVSPAGEIITEIPINTRDISYGILPVIKERSFYTKSGNWFIIISILIILFTLAKNEIKQYPA